MNLSKRFQNQGSVFNKVTPEKIIFRERSIRVSGAVGNSNNFGKVKNSPIPPPPPPLTAFIFNVDVSETGFTSAGQFLVKLVDVGPIDISIDWGDGTSSNNITTYNDTRLKHTYNTYPATSLYEIQITGAVKGWRTSSGADPRKLRDISNWGGFELGQQRSFEGCDELTVSATDAPLITSTNLYGVFNGCSAFNTNISNWDMSSVTNFSLFFSSCIAFNQPIAWDMSSATTTTAMFSNARVFNSYIGDWDVSNVTTMDYMFLDANSFNQDISAWNVGNVANMTEMFKNATVFNQNISTWDVSNVTNMQEMFAMAVAFNQPIGNWTTTSLINAMFLFMTDSPSTVFAFDQDLSGWDINQATNLYYMFPQSPGLSTANYDATLIGWAAQVPLQYNNELTFTNSVRTTGGAVDTAVATIQANVGGAGAITIVDATPISYTFNTKEELQIGVDLWISDNAAALGNYGDINTWAFAPTLTDMSFLFHLKNSFNSNISNWDVSNVIDMSSMFNGANDFNQDISSWDVSNVTSMGNMFIQANAFNQDIGSWDVSNVTSMSFMFYEADSFNQNLSGWCVTNIVSEPSNFSLASALTDLNKPVWGTCPT